MCLYISKASHPQYKKRIAQRDIVVWKVLYRASRYDPTKGVVYSYHAPYQGTRYELGEVNKQDMRKKQQFSCVTIQQGLHSCRTHKEAKYLATRTGNRKVFYAIIPKGSALFFGAHNDVVSDTLIVYKTKEALEAVHGPIAKRVPRHIIAI